MAWYYGTYTCGHEGRTNIVGPTKNRQWISDRHFENVCEECYKLKLEEENKKSMEKANEMELPELIGTEKQIAWANTIRIKMLKDFEDMTSKVKDEMKDFYKDMINYVATTKIKASWFIDERNSSLVILGEELHEEFNKYLKSKEEQPVIEEIKAETTVYPENKITDGVVEIEVKGDTIKAIFEKNEEFRLIVKSLGYEWDGVWKRIIKKTNGSVEDRASELGNKLLNAGFPIRINDLEILDRAVDGKYEQECKRWILKRTKGDYEGWLCISWDGKDDKLYNTARKLPSSKWNGGIVVKAEYYKQVLEFAELYGFKVSEEASVLIEAHIELEKTAKKVNPAKVSD
jgi:hypothetical protein